jgi:sugar (pentulose or hexulose) kinase
MYACLESVILRLGCITKMVNEAAGLKPKQSVIVASGNALGCNPLWQQMLADATSMDVLVDADASSEGTSRGVAIMMAGALQLREIGNSMASCNFEETLEVAHQTKARTGMSQHWKDALSTQESLIGVVAPTWNND